MATLTVQNLIDAGVHFGCRVSRWNPRMAPYIHGRRNLIHVIDLRETLRGVIRAQNLLFHISAEGQSVLWVGTKRQVKGVIADAGERTGMPVVTERWIGGTLTNFSVIRSRLKRLEELEAIDEAAAEEAKLTKKEISGLNREKRKIMRNLGGIREMTSMPGAMVIVDPAREYNAVREARKMGIVIIGLLDTDCDPTAVDIVIPGNDDALKSVRLLVDQLVTAVEEGCAQHRDQMATMGVAEKRDGAVAGPSDEPRPTRGNRPPRRPRPEGGAPQAPGEAPGQPAPEHSGPAGPAPENPATAGPTAEPPAPAGPAPEPAPETRHAGAEGQGGPSAPQAPAGEGPGPAAAPAAAPPQEPDRGEEPPAGAEPRSGAQPQASAGPDDAAEREGVEVSSEREKGQG